MDILISSATHRSGSTMLQRIFNARENTLIWGEHKGVLTDFCNLQKKLNNYSSRFKKQRISYFNTNENPSNWIATMNPSNEFINNAVHQSVKAFLDNLYAQHRETHDIIGFKEVRYGQDELELFRKCYPKAKIILLVRDPRDVWKSHSFNLRIEAYNNSLIKFIQKWKNHVSYYMDFAKKDPKTYFLKYEDIIERKPETINMLLDAANITIEELNSVLNVKISGIKKGPNNPSDLQQIENMCKNIMEQLNYSIEA
ncbi:sulfotransferase [Neobacillus mesonae]|uniref:Sulfotransferase n=1 Tax=Neobacillus mesonae TaxID=1193713 RepID=A0A3Q9QSK0_9BACI|nr:sulfotransferase [Neobacillus mesonae]AZU60411.1 sulfotransferase [Neobacillus mesonae]